MGLIGIGEQNHLFPEATRRRVELESLVPIHRAVLRAMKNQERCADVRRVVDGTKAAFGSIDILISNAGIWGASVADDDLSKTLDDYERIVGTNLKGEYLFGRAVIPIMDQLGLPHFVLEDDGKMDRLLDGAMKLCHANRQPLAICLTQMLHGGKIA